MDERNVIAGGTAVLMSCMLEYLYPLRWFGIAALVVIFADLKFGIAAAKRRGDNVRFSRAVRRTVNKIVDYLCWILLASSLDHALGEPFHIPLLGATILLVVFGVEVNSCFSNYFEAHGKRVNINIFDLFKKKADLQDVTTEEIPQKEQPDKTTEK